MEKIVHWDPSAPKSYFTLISTNQQMAQNSNFILALATQVSVDTQVKGSILKSKESPIIWPKHIMKAMGDTTGLFSLLVSFPRTAFGAGMAEYSQQLQRLVMSAAGFDVHTSYTRCILCAHQPFKFFQAAPMVQIDTNTGFHHVISALTP